jgi:hypothetical protein
MKVSLQITAEEILAMVAKAISEKHKIPVRAEELKWDSIHGLHYTIDTDLRDLRGMFDGD